MNDWSIKLANCTTGTFNFLTVSYLGEQGERGAPGIQGPEGPQGERGERGRGEPGDQVTESMVLSMFYTFLIDLNV